jgi:hypothetical protein
MSPPDSGAIEGLVAGEGSSVHETETQPINELAIDMDVVRELNADEPTAADPPNPAPQDTEAMVKRRPSLLPRNLEKQ